MIYVWRFRGSNAYELCKNYLMDSETYLLQNE